jgi:hypothetical protein
MRKLVLLSFLILSGFGFSQESGALKGTVLDAEMGGDPMLLAHVNVKNTGLTGETNLHGNFEFPAIEPGAYVLVLSYPGYQELEIAVVVKQNTTTMVHGIMQANEIMLEGAWVPQKAVSTLPGADENNVSASLR